MRVAVPMPVKSMQPATEAAIGCAATRDEPPVRAVDQLCDAPRTAVASPHKTH
jgi:hypothetical protein